MSDSRDLRAAADGRPPAQKNRAAVRPHLLEIRPYVPGRPATDVARELGVSEVVKLASNENPYGASPRAIETVRTMVGSLHRYPDGAAQDVRRAIATACGVTAQHVLMSNGSDEMIKMLSETFLSQGDEIVVPAPSFSQYAFGAQVMDAHVREVPLGEDFAYGLDRFLQAVTERTKLLYLCTPNNPTGTWLTHGEVAAFMERVPSHVIVVMDEAYLEYVDTPDPLDSLAFIRAGRPVISLRTFSKIHGLAGLRLGYALADPEWIGYVNQVREPFNANAVAQAAACAALEDREFVRRVRDLNATGREQYYDGLARLGVPFVRTQGNFLLARVGDGMRVFEALLRHGVIVRAGFRGIDQYVRISIGTEEENRRCLEALGEVLRETRRMSG